MRNETLIAKNEMLLARYETRLVSGNVIILGERLKGTSI